MNTQQLLTQRQELVKDDIIIGQNQIYTILEIIGKGGMGIVYKIIDSKGNILVAKSIRYNPLATFEDCCEARKYFLKELNILQSLQHSGLPKIYECISSNLGDFMIMDFVDGQNLQQIAEIRKAYGRTIETYELIEWTIQICAILNYLHKKSIVFRDIKDTNIMITPNNDAKLIDFGIAKTVEQKTCKGTIIGTPGYSPPEQYKGKVYPASDIFSLGAMIIYYYFTNQSYDDLPTPFDFSPLLDKIEKDNDQLAQVLRKATHLDYQKRYSAEEFRKELIKIKEAITPKPNLQTTQTTTLITQQNQENLPSFEELWGSFGRETAISFLVDRKRLNTIIDKLYDTEIMNNIKAVYEQIPDLLKSPAMTDIVPLNQLENIDPVVAERLISYHKTYYIDSIDSVQALVNMYMHFFKHKCLNQFLADLDSIFYKPVFQQEPQKLAIVILKTQPKNKPHQLKLCQRFAKIAKTIDDLAKFIVLMNQVIYGPDSFCNGIGGFQSILIEYDRFIITTSDLEAVLNILTHNRWVIDSCHGFTSFDQVFKNKKLETDFFPNLTTQSLLDLGKKYINFKDIQNNLRLLLEKKHPTI